MSREYEIIQRVAAEFIDDRHRLGAFVGGLLRDAHAAEDVIQEVWVRLAAEIEKGTRIENQPAWCRGVARNLILKHWRSQQSAKVVTQLYKAPTYGTFKQLANEAAGIASKGRTGGLGQGSGTGAMSSQFKQCDGNNDGKLGPDELPAALYDRLDADKDGFVSEEELKAIRQPN